MKITVPDQGRWNDGFDYMITVESAGREHSVAFGDGMASEHARDLRGLMHLLEETGARFEDLSRAVQS